MEMKLSQLFYSLIILVFLGCPVYSKTVDACYTETLLAREKETVTVTGYVWNSDSMAKWDEVLGQSSFWLIDVPLESSLETINGCSILVETQQQRQVPKACKNGAKVMATAKVTFDGLLNAKVRCSPSDIPGGSECAPFRAAAHKWGDLSLTSKGIFLDEKQKCEKHQEAQQAAKEAYSLANPNCATSETVALWRARAESLGGGCP
jgi:hypothetical protein